MGEGVVAVEGAGVGAEDLGGALLLAGGEVGHGEGGEAREARARCEGAEAGEGGHGGADGRSGLCARSMVSVVAPVWGVRLPCAGKRARERGAGGRGGRKSRRRGREGTARRRTDSRVACRSCVRGSVGSTESVRAEPGREGRRGEPGRLSALISLARLSPAPTSRSSAAAKTDSTSLLDPPPARLRLAGTAHARPRPPPPTLAAGSAPSSHRPAQQGLPYFNAHQDHGTTTSRRPHDSQPDDELVSADPPSLVMEAQQEWHFSSPDQFWGPSCPSHALFLTSLELTRRPHRPAQPNSTT